MYGTCPNYDTSKVSYTFPKEFMTSLSFVKEIHHCIGLPIDDAKDTAKRGYFRFIYIWYILGLTVFYFLKIVQNSLIVTIPITVSNTLPTWPNVSG